MRYLLILLTLSLLLVGCNRDNPFFPARDADGYYTGWVHIDRPGMGFDHSFHANLRVYDNSYHASLTDDYGRNYQSYRVEYSYWNDSLEVYFRVRETRWSPQCGHEVYNWEMRMDGRIHSDGRFQGELQVDIDPNDYHSDWCHMDYNPPPTHLGSFNLDRGWNPW